MLTVQGLLEDLALEPAFELGAPARQIRWVHISELEDPTPFLSGGELLLTTGIHLTSAARQRRFVKLLADRGAAGIGLGTGFDHDGLPDALRTEAEARDLALFEVPYETPFIAITERAFTKLVNEQYEVLERGIEVHDKLERLVLAELGLPEVMRAIAESVAGAALLLDDRGGELSRHPQERGISAEAAASIRDEVAARSGASKQTMFVPTEGPLAGRAVAVPVPIAGEGSRGQWLVVVRRRGKAGDLERLLARQAAMVVALELMRERVVRDTERRLAGDVLAEALGGNLGAEELRSRLAPVRARRPGRGRPVRARAAGRRRRRRHRRAFGGRRAGARRDQHGRRAPAALRDLRARRRRPARARPLGPLGARRGRAPARPRRRQPGGPDRARCAVPSTRHAARWRRRAPATDTPPTSPRTAISEPSRCCSRSRTTTRSAPTPTTCCGRSRTARATTAPSCCARWRPSSSATASGSGPRATSTATGTRSATGSAGSRS